MVKEAYRGNKDILFEIDKMTAENKDALDALFVQEADISNEVLRDLLVNYVQFTSEGKIFTKPEFAGLPNKKKILVILLSRKVLKLKKINMDEETVGTEIMSSTGLTRGSVYPALRELEAARLVTSKEGRYWIPSYAISNVRQLFSA
jgi:CRP-like cAMP-binding protein